MYCSVFCGSSLTPPLSLSVIFRLNLCLGEGINVAVGIYATAVTARKPGPIRLYRETNEPVRSKTRTFHTQTGSLLLPSEIKKAQVRADLTRYFWVGCFIKVCFVKDL